MTEQEKNTFLDVIVAACILRRIAKPFPRKMVRTILGLSLSLLWTSVRGRQKVIPFCLRIPLLGVAPEDI